MKRKARPSPAAAPETTPGRTFGFPRRAWWLAGGILILVGLGAGGAQTWRHHATASRIHASLPARPDLSDQPAVLGEMLARAEANARSASTRLESLAELGRLYHANGFHREAGACWQVLWQEQPTEARWPYYLAHLRRAAGDQDGMNTLLQQTLRLAPGYSPARLHLATLQFKSGEPEEAERNYTLRLQAVPQDPHARLGLVRLALQEGQTQTAMRQLEAIVKDTPHFATAHNLFAELLAAAGDVDAARRHRWLGQETLRFREPEDAWLDELLDWCYDYDRLCVLGTVEIVTEQHGKARTFLERAIRLKPGEPRAYELLAGLHLKRGEGTFARDLLEAALPRLGNTTSHGTYAALSQAYRTLQQPADAIRAARLGLARAGDQPELFDALGLALADLGRHGEAVAVWQAGLAQQPGDASMNYNQAVSLLALRRLDDTLAALDRSLTVQPTFLPTLLLRGEIEMEAGHLDLAEKYLRTAVDAHPENPLARRLMAGWHRRMGLAAEANRGTATAKQHEAPR